MTHLNEHYIHRTPKTVFSKKSPHFVLQYLILIRTKSVCGQRAVPRNATLWTVVYTARPVLAALQTSHRRRCHAAVVISREPQSREKK